MRKLGYLFAWIIASFILICILGVIGDQLQCRRNDGFKKDKVITHLNYSSEWDVGKNEEGLRLLDSLLDQPFTYLGKGRQSYAFVSQDGQYVLKFFKQHRLRLPEWLQSLPMPSYLESWRSKKNEERQERVKKYFESWMIAYKELKEETGIVFMHLVPKVEVSKKALLKDLLDSKHEIDLNQTSFLLQHKATWIHPLIEDLMSRGLEIEAEKRVDQIIRLFISRSKKGIIDWDSSVAKRNNIGFLADRCIFIDVGTFAHWKKIREKEFFQKDLDRLEPIYEWLHKRYPHLGVYYRKSVKQAVDSFSFEIKGSVKRSDEL